MYWGKRSKEDQKGRKRPTFIIFKHARGHEAALSIIGDKVK